MGILSSDILKRVILETRLIDQSIVERIFSDAKRIGIDPEKIIISRRILPSEILYSAIAQYLGVKYIDIKKVNISQKVLNLIPENVVFDKKVIPFNITEDGKLEVGMLTPYDLNLINYLKNLTQKEIVPYLISEEDFHRSLAIYHKLKTEEYKKIIEQSKEYYTKIALPEEEAEKAGVVVELFDNILNYAVSLNASDIHFEILKDFSLVRFRIDGMLREMMILSKQVHSAIIARIKMISNLQLDEHLKPQDGRMKIKIYDIEIDVRVSIMPTFYGEKAVLRLLSPLARPSGLEELGLSGENLQKVKKGIEKTNGIILVTGPTGSGKTTTLYTILTLLNRPEVNITTIEDPIEYSIDYINQIQVNPKAGIDFANGLRSILRQDPNIIMVGEIRDKETTDIVIQAALTGHLVLSTLHTNDAPTAIPRLIDLGGEKFLLAAVLRIIIAQRLVRKICLDCISSYQPNQIELQIVKETLQTKKLSFDLIPKNFYKGQGCPSCGFTGYSGRIGIFEVLEVDEEIARFIDSEKFNIDDLYEIVKKKNMISLIQDGFEKVELGITTLNEVLRVTRE